MKNSVFIEADEKIAEGYKVSFKIDSPSELPDFSCNIVHTVVFGADDWERVKAASYQEKKVYFFFNGYPEDKLLRLGKAVGVMVGEQLLFYNLTPPDKPLTFIDDEDIHRDLCCLPLHLQHLVAFSTHTHADWVQNLVYARQAMQVLARTHNPEDVKNLMASSACRQQFFPDFKNDVPLQIAQNFLLDCYHGISPDASTAEELSLSRTIKTIRQDDKALQAYLHRIDI